MRQKDGKPLKFGLLTRKGSVAGDFEIAELTQAMFKSVGMDMQLEVVEAASFLPRLNKAGEPDYDLTNASNNVGSGDGEFVMESHYRSDAVPPRYYNYSWYSNPDVDRLTEQARSAKTLEERNQIYGQVEKIVADDAAWLMLFDVKLFAIMKDDVQGVYLEPAGNNFPAKYAWRGKA
jgi:ABC-type transport system substrate-binding protein